MPSPILVYLGPTPCDEECSQVGEDGFAALNQLECRVWIAQLKRVFPIPPSLEDHLSYAINTETGHDAGYYREVVLKGDYGFSGVADFSNRVESDAPTEWDCRALAQLATGWGYVGYYTDAPTKLDLEQTVTDVLVNADPKLGSIFPDDLEQQAEVGQHPFFGSQGTPYRRVLISPQEVEQQLRRYQEGGYQVLPDNEWENFYKALVDGKNEAPVSKIRQ